MYLNTACTLEIITNYNLDYINKFNEIIITLIKIKQNVKYEAILYYTSSKFIMKVW